MQIKNLRGLVNILKKHKKVCPTSVYTALMLWLSNTELGRGTTA